MDESEATDIVRNWAKEEGAAINNLADSIVEKDAAVGLFNGFKNRAKKWWQEKASK